MESETIFIIAPLLVPFLPFIGILNLRAVCRATHLALRDINLEPSEEERANLVHQVCFRKIDPSLGIKERIAELTWHFHPRIVGNMLVGGFEENRYFGSSRIREIVEVCGINEIDPPTEEAINYLARVYDAMPNDAFELMLRRGGGGLPKRALWEVLRACRRPRCSELFDIGSDIDFGMVGFIPDYFADRENLDFLWNRFEFDNRFTGNMPGLHRAIQTELQQRMKIWGKVDCGKVKDFPKVKTPYILACPYATRAQSVFMIYVADHLGTHGDFVLKMCGPRIMNGWQFSATPLQGSIPSEDVLPEESQRGTLFEQVCAIAEMPEMSEVGRGFEIYEYVMRRLEGFRM